MCLSILPVVSFTAIANREVDLAINKRDSTAKMSASIGDGIGDEEIFPAC